MSTALGEVNILLVTGDLTLNGEKASHLALASWFNALESFGVKVFVLPGNHDILNPWARGFSKDRTYATESITPEEFRSVYRACGFDEAIARDKDSLSYVVAPVPGLRIFMLDSSFYSDNMRLGYSEAGGGLGDGTLDWILVNMKKAKQAGARVLVSMHHSVVDYNPFISEQSTPRCTFYDIATNALSVYPHQYGKVLFSPQKRLFSYRAIPVDVVAWAREEKSQDDRLTGFRAYSARFFRDRSSFMVGRMLASREVQLPRERSTRDSLPVTRS